MAKVPVVVELYYSAAWHDITALDDVYTRDPIAITRGRPDEVQQIPPSTLNLSIENRDGKYSPRNPTSALYGLIGRNQPIRVSVKQLYDTFTRSASNGWGTPDVGGAWAVAEGSAADFSVNGSVAVVSHATIANRATIIDAHGPDQDAVIYFRIPVAPTGGSAAVIVDLRCRWTDGNNNYYVRVSTNAAGTMAFTLNKVVAAAGTTLDTGTSQTLNIAHTYGLRMDLNGPVIRGKFWDTTTTVEPETWDVSATDTSLTTGNLVSVFSVPLSVTNALPYEIWFDNFLVRTIRFTGEVESWPQRWSVEGNDVWAPITANGITRRLNAPGTTRPEDSALKRAVLASAPIAYWPLEEPGEATALASGLVGGLPMVFGTLPPLCGNAALAPGAVAGVDVGNEGSATGLVTGGTAGSWSVSWVGNYLRKDADPVKVLTVVAGLITADVVLLSGAIGTSMVGPNNSVTLDGTNVATSNLATVRPHHFVVTATQAGANVTVTMRIDGVQVDTDTLTSVTCIPPTSVKINGDPTLTADSLADGTRILQGHVAIYDSVYTTDLTAAIAAHAGETAAARMTRLCTEEGIPFTLADSGTTELVGVQRAAPFLDLLQDAADADGGILYEPRDSLGLAYRTHISLYNAVSAIDLDYAAGDELAPPLDPVEDTDATGNDVTVTRYQGSSARAVKETGSLNVQERTDDPDGVGRYKKDVTLVLYADAQNLQQAAWRRHLGTWDEARYPVVNLDLTAMDAAAKTTLIADAVNLDIGDRLTITSAPEWVSHDSIVQHAQGFTETIESHRWTIAANATPALPYDVLRLETDTANLSRIPASLTGTTTNEPLDTTEVGVDIISVTARWIDSAAYSAQFPFKVIIGGEVMTVTACSGTGLTQTFTVTRSVNGAVKSHAIGAPVQLFRPPVIAR